MSEYEVPEGMWQAARDAMVEDCQARRGSELLRVGLQAAIRWISENPRVPTDTQANELWRIALEQDATKNETTHAAKNLVLEWQRICWLKPEPEVPENLLEMKFRAYTMHNEDRNSISLSPQEWSRIIEAVARIQK